ncbi:MAG: acylneuraminate cytidylyltransferase [Proteobacteria bacterium]|nr:acylneuraminate cytidylyltransferase [Pseudomonadota bacterium]
MSLLPDNQQAIAIIPARGGSKRMPNKNLWPVAGEPLLVHSLRQARQSTHVSEVCVSTDDDKIAAVATAQGAEVIRRPPELASDVATSESAILHVLEDRQARGIADPDIVVFLQCTSPVRRSDDIDRAIEQYVAGDADTMFSACRNEHFIWARRKGRLESITYDYRARKRSQDVEDQYHENGSMFLFRPDFFRAHGNRLGGKIAVFEMDYWSSFEIDTPQHVELIDWILRRPEYRPADSFPDVVSLVVFDFDGVMTDNTVAVSESGEEWVRCNRSDGLGIDRLRDAGIPMIILSTEQSQTVAARAKKLRLEHYQGIGDKGEFLKNYLDERGIAPEEVVYLGNDVNDRDCFELVGCPVAVADAHREIVQRAQIVLNRRGGEGAVRELSDRLLQRKKAG